MSVGSLILAGILSVLFLALGTAKILALEPMRGLAEHSGLSVAAYRGIGALEVAGAVGLLVGLVVPPLGALAAVGLLLLMVGALATHLRNRDALRKLGPAVVAGLLVIAYLAVLAGGSR